MGLYAFQSVALHRGGPSAREGRTLSPLASRGEAPYRAHACHACHACHQLRGHGGFLGPDLTGAAARVSPDDLAQLLDTGRRQMPPFAWRLLPALKR